MAPLADPSDAAREGPAAEPRARGSRALLVLAGGLLLGEYLLISALFDASAVGVRGGAWKWIARIGQLGPLMITTAATWFTLFRLEPVRLDALPRSGTLPLGPVPVRRGPSLGAHVVCAALLFWLTRRLFALDSSTAPSPAWFLLWSMLAVGTAATLLFGVLGGARWFRVLLRDSLVAVPLGVLVWQTGALAADIWPLGFRRTLAPAATILLLLGQDARALPDSPVLFTTGWGMRVFSNCAGYEGLGIVLSLSATWLLAFRHALRWPRALLLLPLAIGLVWAVNVLRFVVLALIGTWFGSSTAVDLFHSAASWLVFSTTAIATLALAKSSLIATGASP